MKNFSMMLLILCVLCMGCSLKETNEIPSFNGHYAFYWEMGRFLDDLEQWIGYDVHVMLRHDDFREAKYTKIPMSSHINFYTIQISIWRYEKNAVRVQNNLMMYVFTDKQHEILSIVLPSTSNNPKKKLNRYMEALL